MTLAMFGMSAYSNFKHWLLARNLKHLIKLQNDLHELFKQILKILRRAYGRKAIITEVHEKQEYVLKNYIFELHIPNLVSINFIFTFFF